MNDLKAIYNKLLEFGDNHNMVNQTLFLMTEDELEHLDIDFRCIIFIVSTSNIGRDLNSPTYGIDFEIMVMDKTDRFDNLRTFESVQENIFVIGLLQDYLQQEGYDVDVSEMDLYNEIAGDYNVTSAACEFSFKLARHSYNCEIDTNITIPRTYYTDKIKVYYADSLENANTARANDVSQSGGVAPNLSDLSSGNYKMYMYSEVAVDLIYNQTIEGDRNFAMYYPEPYYKTVSLEANTMTEVEVINSTDIFPMLLGLGDDSVIMTMAFARLQDVDPSDFFNFGEDTTDTGYSRGASWARRPNERIGIWLSSYVNDDI